MKKKKRYGQNFLKNKEIVHKIVTFNDIYNKNIIEIGPGEGILSKEILKYANSLISFEIDLELKGVLTKITEKKSNFLVVYEDFLNSDLSKHLVNDEYYLIANIPYYITGPILEKVMNEKKIINATIMMQKEVGLRILSTSGKNYNALSIFMQTLFDIKKVVDVKKGNFDPIPKVDSIVLNFRRNNKYLNKINNYDNYKQIVLNSFLQKRKTLINNLSETYKISKEQIIITTKELNLNIDNFTRAENLSIDDFIALSNGWNND